MSYNWMTAASIPRPGTPAAAAMHDNHREFMDSLPCRAALPKDPDDERLKAAFRDANRKKPANEEWKVGDRFTFVEWDALSDEISYVQEMAHDIGKILTVTELHSETSIRYDSGRDGCWNVLMRAAKKVVS